MISDLQKARELARGIVSDVVLYNAPKIRSGLQRDNLFDALEPEIKQAREYYAEQVPEEIRRTTNFFNEALVDLLFAPFGDVPTAIW